MPRTQQEIEANYEREKALAGFPLGALFARYDNLTSEAWAYDSQIGSSESPTAGQLKKGRALWAQSDAARIELLPALFAHATLTAERDRYKAPLEMLRAEADRAADMLTNGESAVKVFHVLDKALAALSPTPPKEPSHE